MNRSIEHQDQSGMARLPLIVINEQGNEVPVPGGVDPSIFAAARGYEALIRCLDHPDVPAVDCLICAPEEN